LVLIVIIAILEPGGFDPELKHLSQLALGHRKLVTWGLTRPSQIVIISIPNKHIVLGGELRPPTHGFNYPSLAWGGLDLGDVMSLV
jgi:hypothetical protein